MYIYILASAVTDAISNGKELSLSGVSKQSLKEWDGKSHKIKYLKMMGINKENTGEFVEEIRDLDKQQRDYLQVEEELKKRKVFIDEDILIGMKKDGRDSWSYNKDYGKDSIDFFSNDLEDLSKKGGFN